MKTLVFEINAKLVFNMDDLENISDVNDVIERIREVGEAKIIDVRVENDKKVTK